MKANELKKAISLFLLANSFVLPKPKGGDPVMPLIRILSLDRIRFGDYDNVPVNPVREIHENGYPSTKKNEAPGLRSVRCKRCIHVKQQLK
jgi:hypothetical protein